MKLAKGDRVIWYDSRLWGPRDIGHNQHCIKQATVMRSYTGTDGRPAIDLLFDHNPRVSRGHFNYYPYDLTAREQKAGALK